MSSPEALESVKNAMSRHAFTRRLAGYTVGVALAAPAVADARPSTENRLDGPVTPHVVMEEKEVRHRIDLLKVGPWQYMAGAQVVQNGLKLMPTGLSFVDKRNNNRIVPNPPVNMYGPRLEIKGDFSVTAHARGDTPLTFQLYGAVPKRFDDFRYEESRLEVTSGEDLGVRIWDGSSQTPTVTESFKFDASGSYHRIKVSRIDNQLVFSADGKVLGALPKGNIFNTGKVWMGLNSEQGVTYVNKLIARPLNGDRLGVVNTSTLKVVRRTPRGLQSLVRRRGIDFDFGAAAALGPMVADKQYAQLFLGGEVGSITTENGLKPQDVQPKEGVFTFGEADALVDLALRHGLEVHGHALIFGNATPKWMDEMPYETDEEKQRLGEVVINHLKTVVRHFKGRINLWHVTNEASEGFNDEVHFTDNIGYRAFGKDYIKVAFRTVHEANPDAELLVNDYGPETNPQGRGKFNFEEIIKPLKEELGAEVFEEKVKFGVQGHVNEIPRDTIDQRLMELMRKFGTLAVETRITELDVTGAKGPEAQAKQYADVVRMCLEVLSCEGVTFWGLSDKYGAGSWVDENDQLQPADSLPYTADYRRKLAVKAMREVLLDYEGDRIAWDRIIWQAPFQSSVSTALVLGYFGK